MGLLVKLHTEEGEMAEDDPRLSYMVCAWARITNILGKKFKPYLLFVMGPVIKAASLKFELVIVDGEGIFGSLL